MDSTQDAVDLAGLLDGYATIFATPLQPGEKIVAEAGVAKRIAEAAATIRALHAEVAQVKEGSDFYAGRYAERCGQLAKAERERDAAVEVLRSIWLEAHETIPRDGEEAAFAALDTVMRKASTFLATITKGAEQ